MPDALCKFSSVHPQVDRICEGKVNDKTLMGNFIKTDKQMQGMQQHCVDFQVYLIRITTSLYI